MPQYIPTCATNCGDEVLKAVGATDCANLANVEVAEISELYLSNTSATVGEAVNRLATYTAFGDNAAALTTWKAAQNNATAGALRYVEGIGEKPEPEETTITLAKGKQINIGTKHRMTYRIDVVDKTTHEFLLHLQGCKGTYHAWFATDTYIYGGQDGMLINIEKVTSNYSGGRGSNAFWTITFSWSNPVDPLRDPKTW
jgi:hypothetical protein